jgi:hypothetical protein
MMIVSSELFKPGEEGGSDWDDIMMLEMIVKYNKDFASRTLRRLYL